MRGPSSPFFSIKMTSAGSFVIYAIAQSATVKPFFCAPMVEIWIFLCPQTSLVAEGTESNLGDEYQ